MMPFLREGIESQSAGGGPTVRFEARGPQTDLLLFLRVRTADQMQRIQMRGPMGGMTVPAVQRYAALPVSCSIEETAAWRAAWISSSSPQSHIRPNFPTEEMCTILMFAPFSASLAARLM